MVWEEVDVWDKRSLRGICILVMIFDFGVLGGGSLVNSFEWGFLRFIIG